jgi:hypothetical protein
MVLIGTVANTDEPGAGGSGGGTPTTLPSGVYKISYPDSGGRDVYHHGALFNGTVPYHLPAYTEAGESVPAHYWNARWTKRVTPPSIVRTAAQLVADHRMFPYGLTGATASAAMSRVPYTIMGTSNITKYMPTTGERPDIGLITDPSADFMLGRSHLPMFDWAHANDSCPLHFRDETTTKPINLLTYPKAGCGDPGNGTPYLLKGEPDPISPGYSAWGGGFSPQQAHMCEMSYVAHMATRDLGFFENVQYNANFTVLCDPYVSRQRNIATVSGEPRGIAWALRNLFMASIATQDVVTRAELPDTCHGNAYWAEILDNQLDYYSPIMSDPTAQTFRLLTGTQTFGPWQVDYQLSALAFGVLTGHSAWTPLYLWCLGNAVSRMSGNAGIPPGLGTGYYLQAQPGWTWRQTFDSMVGDPNGGISQAQHDALLANPLNGGVAQQGNGYMMTTRAVLKMADYLDQLGLADVRGTYSDFDTALNNAQTMFENYGSVNPRVAIKKLT